MLDRLLRWIDRVAYGGAAVAAVACLAMALMLIVEVVATSFFAWSQPWAVEYATYLLAVSLFLGSGWTLRAGGHIRVGVLFSLLPAPAVRFVDLAGTAFALGVIGFAAGALVEQAVRTLQLGSRSYFPSETPLVYPQALLALAFVVLTLALLARLLRLLRGQAAELPQPGSSAGH